MTTEKLKLLTEAEWCELVSNWCYKYESMFNTIMEDLHKRGLIAPEPVDPLREAVESLWHFAVGPKDEAVKAMTAELRARLPAAALAAIDEQGE